MWEVDEKHKGHCAPRPNFLNCYRRCVDGNISCWEGKQYFCSLCRHICLCLFRCDEGKKPMNVFLLKMPFQGVQSKETEPNCL